jgi:hypothetical protein
MVRAQRQERDIRRVRHAAEAARGEHMPAIAIDLAQIDAAFDEAAAVNAFKMRVERLLQLGPDHPGVRARFGARAARLAGRDLATAILIVERWWRNERKAFQIASAFGCAARLSLDVLSELRLILRFMRFCKIQGQYEDILAVLRDEPIAAAAE